jgi:hypothetical protein
MARRAIHKRDAKRYLRTARIAAVGLALMAGALWALDIPGVNRPVREAKAPEAPPPAPAAQPVVRAVSLDRDASQAMAERLEAATAHKPAAAPAPTGATGPTGPTGPAQATGPDWKYFGPIYDGLTVRALVSVKGRQRVLREGSEVDGTTLKSIAPDTIVIHDSTGEHEIHRATGDGTRVSWMRGGRGPAAGAPAVTGAPGQTPGGAASHTPPPGGAASGDAQARSLERLRRLRARSPGGAGADLGAGAGTAAGAATGELPPNDAAAQQAIVQPPPDNVVPMDDFIAEQNKLLGAYPDLAIMEYKMRETGLPPEQILKEMSVEYQKRGLTLPLNLTPEQIEVREKLITDLYTKNTSGTAGAGGGK